MKLTYESRVYVRETRGWLKFDGRYEITNTTDGISNGFFLTYNKK